jgi:hypothetical protein
VHLDNLALQDHPAWRRHVHQYAQEHASKHVVPHAASRATKLAWTVFSGIKLIKITRQVEFWVILHATTLVKRAFISL